MSENYIPAIITASVALIAAISAQFLNNYLSNRREQKKYHLDIYGKLIADKLNLLIEYAYLYSNAFSEEEFSNVNLEKILNSFEDDIQYFNSTLQLKYSYYKVSKYIEGCDENVIKRLQFELAFYFLIYTRQVLDKANIKTDKSYDYLLDHVTTTYAYLSIGTFFEGYEKAKNNMIGLNRAYINILSDYSIKCYVDVISNDYKYPAEIINMKVNKKIDKYY